MREKGEQKVGIVEVDLEPPYWEGRGKNVASQEGVG